MRRAEQLMYDAMVCVGDDLAGAMGEEPRLLVEATDHMRLAAEKLINAERLRKQREDAARGLKLELAGRDA